MPRPADAARAWLVDVADATDRAHCGGKALGLARLVRAGFAVPAGICVTAGCCRDRLAAAGIVDRVAALAADPGGRDPDARAGRLADIRRRVESLTLPDALARALDEAVSRILQDRDGAVIVRSSAADEDDGDASFAGIHASIVVDTADPGAVRAAVTRCWASLWTERSWRYRERLGRPHATAEMAVVVQRLVAAERAGVAFSLDPLTSDRDTVVIEATRGDGAALVSGRVTPDTYRVSGADGAAPGDGIASTLAVDGAPVLDPAQIRELARLSKAAERALAGPVDVEWVFDGREFWLVQARPITTLAAPATTAAERETLWTRANLKEVYPELPSPLTLSYLSIALDRMFSSYHAAQGYALADGAPFVRVFRGRPYLNLTRMHQMTLARGGDPAVVGRLFGGGGGAASGPPAAAAPGPTLGDRLRLVREMLATFFWTPRRGRRLFRRMRREAPALRALALDHLDDAALIAHLEIFRTTLLHETTMRRLHEVVSAQSRAYMALDQLLAAWVGSQADVLVKRLMTGLGTLPNARMTYRLMELGALARSEPRVRAFFLGELDDVALRGYRATLAGTRFLVELDRFLEAFGHRGPYESDVMSARFSEDPSPVLRLVGLHALAEDRVDPTLHRAERAGVRQTAQDDVRHALGQGRGRLAFTLCWTIFTIACDALQRLLALRDECRHVTTYLVAHMRRVALEIGRRATRDGLLARPDDIFFVSLDELPRVLTERDRDWRGLTADRRMDRARDERLEAPDLLRGERSEASPTPETTGDDLLGFGVSPGTVIGTVQVLRSAQDIRHLRGQIVVFPTIEPSLTPIFPLVRGLVAEMGGLLSHASILAREYGLPAVVNVPDATRRLRDGDLVELDGTTGRIRMVERGPGVLAASAAVGVLSGTEPPPDPGAASGTAHVDDGAGATR